MTHPLLKLIDTTEKLAYAFGNLKLEPQDDVSYHLKIILNYLNELDYHKLIECTLSKDEQTDHDLKKAIFDLQLLLSDLKIKKLAKQYNLLSLYE